MQLQTYFDGNPISPRPLNRSETRICQPERQPAPQGIADLSRIIKEFFMKTSAECRWFWRKDAAAALGDWFVDSDIHDIRASGGDTRTDHYLADANQAELGIKRRGTDRGVEIKGLVSLLGAECLAPPFEGPIELWTKWVSDTLTLNAVPLIPLRKRRWLRQFDTSESALCQTTLNLGQPKQGCTVEYTEILVDGFPPWVTLGFEAFGPLEGLTESLQRTAAWLASRRPPAVGPGVRASYPEWLRQLDGAQSNSNTA
jgi:hypothetical protein